MTVFDPSRAAESIVQLAGDFERRAQQYQELEGRMTALTVTESSAGGRVRVSVDSNGNPTVIDLSASSRGMDPAVLSAEIMSCLRGAQSKLRAQVTDLVHNTVGDDAAGASIVDRFASRFPDPHPDEAPAYAPPRTSAPPPMTPASAPTWPTGETSAESPRPQSESAAPWGSPQQPPLPRSRKPDRDQIVTPDEPDADDEYYNRKSWLI